MRRDPPAISLITNRPVEDTWRSFQRQFITGEGVPLARQSIDTSEPDNTCKRSPIWMLTSPWPSMDFTELFPDWISAPLLPKQKNGIVSHFGSSLAYIRDRNVFAQPMDTVFGYLMDIGYWILINPHECRLIYSGKQSHWDEPNNVKIHSVVLRQDGHATVRKPKKRLIHGSVSAGTNSQRSL